MAGHFHISHNRLISLTEISGLNTEQSQCMEIHGDLSNHYHSLVEYCCIFYGQ